MLKICCNTTQNKYRGGWGISTEVDHRDLYLTSPDMADLFKMYVFFHRGPKSLPPAPTIAGISPTGVDALGIIWVNDSGASLISGTIDSDRKNYKIHDFWQIFRKNTKKNTERRLWLARGLNWWNVHSEEIRTIRRSQWIASQLRSSGLITKKFSKIFT